jgi:hypothetical protein
MKRCEKSPAKDKNLPLEPIIATRQISRLPVMRAAFPIGDLPFRAFLGLSRTTTRDAHRRSGGEFGRRKHRRKKSRPARSSGSVGYK